MSLAGLAKAWDVAALVSATAYGVTVEAIQAESRGRGPRPPRSIWTAKKMAIHLAVVLSDCDYAELARHVGLHKDTISSHCASVREACAVDHATEELAASLETSAKTRILSDALAPLTPADIDPLEVLLKALSDFGGALARQHAAGALHPTLIRPIAASSDAPRASQKRDRNAA